MLNKMKKVNRIFCAFFMLICWTSSTTFAEEIKLSSNQMIPIVLKQNSPSKEISFDIDNSPSLMIDVTSSIDLFSVNLLTPSGNIVTPNNIENYAGEYVEDTIGNSNSFLPGIIPGYHYIYNIPNPMSGTWKVIISGTNLSISGKALIVSITADNSLKGGIFTNSKQYIVGEPVLMIASLFENSIPVSGANVKTQIRNESSNKVIKSFILKDDGNDPDYESYDGLYSGEYMANVEGDFTTRVSISGINNDRTYDLTFASSFSVRNPIAKYNNYFNDEPVDDNNNGLIESINIHVGFDVELKGDYKISLSLTGSNNKSSTFTIIKELNSSFGQIVTANFTKEEIFKIGVDGPYTISSVTIERLDNGNWYIMDEQTDIGETIPYSLTDFEKYGISINGILSDNGIDTDKNGLYNYLEVKINVDLMEGGFYQWSAKIADEFGTEIEFKENSANLIPGNNTIYLTYDGEKIGEIGLDGPYKIMNFLMFGSGKSAISNNVGETSFYSASEFEGGAMIGDLDEDGDCDYDDYLAFRDCYGACEGDSNYMPGADLDGDGCVTMNDYRQFRALVQ